MFDSFEGQKGDEMRRSFLNEAGKSGELLRKARSLACFGNQYYKPPPLVDRFQCSRFLVTLLLESGKLYSHRSFGGSWTWKKATHTHTNTLGRRLPKRKEGRKWSLPVSLLSDLIPPRGRKKRRDPLETRCSLMGWHTFPFYSLDFSRVPRPFSTEPFPICQYLLVFFRPFNG